MLDNLLAFIIENISSLLILYPYIFYQTNNKLLKKIEDLEYNIEQLKESIEILDDYIYYKQDNLKKSQIELDNKIDNYIIYSKYDKIH